MSAPKWTPGPYEVYEAYGRRDNVGAKDGHVATCEREEDAPLLAAAPEMYKALEKQQAAIEALIHADQNRHSDRLAEKASHLVWEARSAKQEAQAKARGESS